MEGIDGVNAEVEVEEKDHNLIGFQEEVAPISRRVVIHPKLDDSRYDSDRNGEIEEESKQSPDFRRFLRLLFSAGHGCDGLSIFGIIATRSFKRRFFSGQSTDQSHLGRELSVCADLAHLESFFEGHSITWFSPDRMIVSASNDEVSGMETRTAIIVENGMTDTSSWYVSKDTHSRRKNKELCS